MMYLDFGMHNEAQELSALYPLFDPLSVLPINNRVWQSFTFHPQA